MKRKKKHSFPLPAFLEPPTNIASTLHQISHVLVSLHSLQTFEMFRQAFFIQGLLVPHLDVTHP